jgi:sugar phosphate isomerase/epimerase
MLSVGLNPFGLAYTLGLQGRGTPRANPRGTGLEGFIAIANELGAKTLEIWEPWIADMNEPELGKLKDRLASLGMTPVISGGLTTGPVDRAIRMATILGAEVVRIVLTPILCGDRNAAGPKWRELVTGARAALKQFGPQAAAAGVWLAIENHQDFRSEELVEFCEDNEGVGICFDTANTFPVAEAPLPFTRWIAPHVRHVHLKDYVIQWTDEGYRLIRCAVGDGAVPFAGIMAILAEHHDSLPAVIEIGALEARHVRLFTPDWWKGYPQMTAAELAPCLAAARVRRLPEEADYRTPWERQEDETLIQYELAMVRRSASNLKTLGLMG